MIKMGKPLPKYYTEKEYKQIVGMVDDFYKRIYYFYRGTGLRLFEPFDGEIDGNYLRLNVGRTKNSYERKYYLTDEQLLIINEMRDWIDQKVSNGIATRTCAINYISTVWRYACKKVEIGKTKFHYLRHTFAVIEWIKCRDIYLVCKKMGHSSVTTTEIYAKFELSELEIDFPQSISSVGHRLWDNHKPHKQIGKTILDDKADVVQW